VPHEFFDHTPLPQVVPVPTSKLVPPELRRLPEQRSRRNPVDETILSVTHNITEALFLSSRVIVLAKADPS